MQFAEAAKQAFSFLEHAGFRLTERDSVRLRYESTQAFVVIEWDPRSGELDVLIGPQPKKGESRDAFSLTDLLRMEDVDVPERKIPFQVADESRLKPFIDKLAEDTRSHAQPALTGDRMFFRRLRDFRNAQAQGYMRDMELQRIRAEAKKAWQNRELDKLISLYTLIEDRLTASEKAKLAYAKKYRV